MTTWDLQNILLNDKSKRLNDKYHKFVYLCQYWKYMKNFINHLKLDRYALKYQNINWKDTRQNNDNGGLWEWREMFGTGKQPYRCYMSREAEMCHG